MNILKGEKLRLLHAALARGASLRVACKEAGVGKHTAQRHRSMYFGGIQGLEAVGVKIKKNRWV